MPSLLRMPEVAADTPGATLLEWQVPENVPFAAAATLVTLETAKAVVDVAAEEDGVVLRRLVGEGTEVAVGQPIALLGAPGETVDDVDRALTELGVGAPARPGRGPDPDTTPGVGASGGQPLAPGWRLFASPLARRIATDAGLALDDIRGTGPNKRIMREDVESALAARSARGAADPRPVPVTPPVPVTAPPDVVLSGSRPRGDRPGGAPYTDLPLTRLRTAIAARLTQSQQSVPHFYLSGVARVDKLLRLRTRINDDVPVRVSVNDLVLKAVARAHQQVPAMNVIWTPDAIRQFTSVDVAVAVTTPEGLLTPVVRDVDRLALTAIAAATQDVVERSRAGRLQQHELDGGSITVSNLGMYGTREFAAIINPPHAAILAVGAAAAEPVITRGRVAAGTTLHLTLSVDHRPVNGATAAEWMAALISLLESPLRLLA